MFWILYNKSEVNDVHSKNDGDSESNIALITNHHLNKLWKNYEVYCVYNIIVI